MENIETEVSFIVNSNRIDELTKIIMKIGEKNKFLPRELTNQPFTDFYYDNSELGLSKKKIALRLRIFDDKRPKITLKKTQNENGLFSERLEMEDYFSEDFLRTIIIFLNQNGFKFDFNLFKELNLSVNSEPSSILDTLGFKIIQKRNTNRQLINLFKDSELLYEIAIDNTNFQVPEKDFKYISMEIESKSPKNTKHENELLVSFFMDKSYQNLFRLWKFNKLITGFAIINLFSCGILTEKHLENKNYLKNTTLDIIEKFLQKCDY